MNNYYILNVLSKSKFRSSFKLKENDIKYVKEKGMDTIKNHAYDFINKRLKDIRYINDGKQTPTHGHPIFIAQHACACCCRGCIEKWHKIPKTKILDNNDIDYIVDILLEWIKRQC